MIKKNGKMTNYNADEVNIAFARICPELKSRYAVYPFPESSPKDWLIPSTEGTYDGKPVVIPSDKESGNKKTESGLKEDYVFCKAGPVGKGYYHVLTKTAYVNLCTRLNEQGSGKFLCFGDSQRADQWDTCRRIVYNRSRANRPDDKHAADAAMDHMVGPVSLGSIKA